MTRLLVVFTALWLCLTHSAEAEDFCVGTATQLQNALNQAAIDGEDSVVHIRAGTLNLVSDVEYRPTSEGFLTVGSLTVRGGYNSDCSARTGNTALATSNDSNVVMVTQRGSVRLLDLNFSAVNLFVRSDPLGTCSNSNRYFEFTRLLLSNALLSSDTLCQDVEIRESLFINGQPLGEFADVSLRVYLVTNSDYRFPKLTIINSTVNNGLTVIENCCDGKPQARIYNSVFNRSGDEIVNEAFLTLVNNRYDGIDNVAGGSILVTQDNSSANANLDPQFVPNPGSAMVNSGTSTVPGGLSETDVYGIDRTIGSRVDRGAAESSVDGTGIYTVTNASSAGSGSLAAAINLANLDDADNVIRFNISGGCPKRINVSPGLVISDQLRIEGNSQPGSLFNNTRVGWNGAPCIILDGLNNAGTAFSTDGELSVNDESIDIFGLAFERFDSAVLLSYGVDHRVRGNQFGGRIGTSGPVLRANNNAVFVAGEGRTVIGGGGVNDINLIGGSLEAGVVIAGDSSHDNHVVANLIGIDKGGFWALPNQDGVRISSSGNRVSYNRIGGNSRDGVVLRSANAFDNELYENILGSSAAPGVLMPAANARMGVLLEESAHDNLIINNTIGRNGDSGVRVLTTAAGHNEISGNSIDRNGAIGIDLGSNGVTVNALDLNLCPLNGCAANGELNYPVIESAILRPAGAFPIYRPLRIRGHLTSVVRSEPYRIEFYASDDCDASEYGQGQRFLGSTSVVVAAAGFCSNNNCAADFSLFVPETDAAVGDWISAITIAPNGDTSEFSACAAVATAPLPDAVFANGFE